MARFSIRSAAAAGAVSLAILAAGISQSAWAESPKPVPSERDYSGNRHSILSSILWYAPNRVLDLMDAIRLSMSFGPAGSANVRITNKIVAGVSHMDVERIGFLSPRQEKRRISPWWLFKKGWEFPFVKGGAAYDEANPPSNFLVRCGRAVMRSIHKGFSHLHWRWNGGHAHERIEDECGARFFQVETGCVNRPPWEVGADAHFLLIGARAGIDLSDIGDFLAGFILWDPHDDDKGAAWGRPE